VIDEPPTPEARDHVRYERMMRSICPEASQELVKERYTSSS